MKYSTSTFPRQISSNFELPPKLIVSTNRDWVTIEENPINGNMKISKWGLLIILDFEKCKTSFKFQDNEFKGEFWVLSGQTLKDVYYRYGQTKWTFSEDYVLKTCLEHHIREVHIAMLIGRSWIAVSRKALRMWLIQKPR